jgi:hypothetical protein
VAERQANDFYPTPAPLAVAICRRIAKVLPNGHFDVIEPSAGAGAFVRPLRELWSLQPLIAIDIDPNVEALRAAGADDIHTADWGTWVKTYRVDGPTLVVGNPPFSLAHEHISAGLDYLLPGSHICFLLKLNFFGGKERERVFWRQGQLRYLIPIIGRPTFVKGEKASNDTNEYGVFIWEVGFSGRPEILFPHIFWKDT